MSGEDIVSISTETLEAMSDEQLFSYFSPILESTRPKQVVEDTPKPKKTKVPKGDFMQQALALLNQVQGK